MLYGRVLKILEVFMLAKSQCAKELGVTHKTFSGYLKPEGEHNLWQYLPKFLEWYPRLSRQWVYFGEGPMLIGHGVPLNQDVPLHAIAEAVDAMVKDARGTEADVYRYICGISVPEHEHSTGHGERVHQLEQEVLRLQKELLEAKDKIIALHEEKAVGRHCSTTDVDTRVRGVHS